MKLSFLILLFFISNLAIAGDKAPTELPPDTIIMPAKKVLLILDEQRSINLDYPSRPCVIDDTVNLAPGEKIFIEAEIRDNRLVNLKQVESVEHPDRTIELEFTQNQERDMPFMMLSISNPFPKGLKYQSSIQYPMKEGFYKTSNVGVRARLKSFESWPQPLTRILLKNFELVNKDDQLYTKP